MRSSTHWVGRLASLAALAVVLSCQAPVATALPAGVPSSQADQYTGNTFKCLDGSKTLPMDRVNDDLCDCADGSDEPGTSACANGKFYCVNRGFRGRFVPASIVGDSICDCCDGSDEAAAGTNCPNTCMADGAQWRQEQAERIKKAQAGSQQKRAYIEQARTALASSTARKQDLERQLQESEAALEQAQTQKEAAEKAESDAKQAKLAANREEIVGRLGLRSMSADELRTLMVDLIAQAGVSEKAVELLRAHVQGKATVAGKTEEEAKAQAEASVNWQEPASAEAGSDPAADAARTAFTAAEEKRNAVKRNLDEADKTASTDFGPDNEFYAIKDKCIEKRVQKYTYKVCFFESAKQDHTGLGSFSGFGEADGKTDYSVMQFTGGSRCWNGPARSMKVMLECGETEEIIAVDEPSTCAYEAKVTSPAACDTSFATDLQRQLDEVNVHDEL